MEFWSQLNKLQILFLHDNPLGNFRAVESLSACSNLTILTVFDSPLSLRPYYRHRIVNTVWSLKCLDHHVISDEEIIEDVTFGGRFAACSSHFVIKPCEECHGSKVMLQACLINYSLLNIKH